MSVTTLNIFHNLKNTTFIYRYGILKLFLICLSVLFLNYSQSFAQNSNIKFKHLTINDGLSQNAVFAILQDSKGFMWFGTKDGLNRYDGYSFTVFYHNPFDSSTISANYITTLFEDSRGLIWIGTLDGGVSIYQYHNGKFLHIDVLSLSNEKMSFSVSSIIEDADSNIWIGTRGNGLFRISITNKELFSFKFKHFLNDPHSISSISHNNITSMLIDSKGVLWIGTLNYLNRFDPVDEQFTRLAVLTKNPAAPNDILENGIASIYECSNGDFWLGTLSGLVLLNRKTGEYELIPHHYTVFRFGWGSINKIVEDVYGKLWIATPGELMIFDPIKRKYQYFRNHPLDPQSLSFNIVSCIFKDRTGILWVGTSGGGVNLHDPKDNRFSTLVREKDVSSRISGFSIRSIFEDSSGYLWISGDVLYRWNRKTNELKSYETNSNLLENFGNTGAYSIYQSSSGFIWFATTQGLFRYNPLTENVHLYKYNPKVSTGLPEKEVYTIFEDGNKNVWIVTKSYLCKIINIEKGYLKKYQYRKPSLNNQRVRPVAFQDGKNRIWIGTKAGLILFNQLNASFTAYRNNPSLRKSLNNNLIKSLCPDPYEPDKYLWIGTAGGGLNRFDIDERTFSHYTEKDGLPNNVVYGILSDKEGNLWLSTNKGLSRFNIRTKKFRNFNVSDGLQSNEFNTGACFKSKSGEMFFGGINGLNYFIPEDIKSNPFKPSIVITSLRILNRSNTLNHNDKTSIIQKPFDQLDKISLSYDDDFIQFEFASLDYSAPEKNQYAYKLENFNEDWVYSGINRTATYTNLSPGKYVFRVKGTNNDGVWNEAGTSISLIITPPWWSTWWAYLLYGLASLTGLYLIRRYELNRVKLKNQLKLEKVQSVSLRNLDKLKSRFFANISHEFRTPLTLILGQIDSVLSSELKTKEKGKLQVANRNARRLLTLINQLLDLSKIEAGNMELNAELHNIVSFLKNLFYSFESLAEKNKISLKFKSQYENIPLVFDTDKMEKVFYNLLSNALKFTPANGKVMVTLKVFNETGLEISIKDNGIGIGEKEIHHIFNRFYQVDSSATREREGTGIGLALAKELIELHKGTISVNSKEGDGTEFIIKFSLDKKSVKEEKPGKSSFKGKILLNDPSIELIDTAKTKLSQQFTEDFANSVQIPVKTPGENGLMKKNIILIVEDNSDVRNYISEQLEKKYKIIEASDGAEGIMKAQNEIPDLIITDVMMPKMDGYDLCNAIRSDEKTSHIPIIMLTAKASLDDKIVGLETGIDVYLTKPFSAKELVVRVNNLISQRERLRKRFSGETIIKPSDVTSTSIDQIFLRKVLNAVDSHIDDEDFNVENLANEVCMSVSQLNRKLRALIDQPAGQLIRSMRLNRAADLLQQSAGSVAEICYMVGFNDQSYFTRSFKKQFGSTPSEFKKHSR